MPKVQEVSLNTASQLWEHLSPAKRQSNSNNRIIYRGHATTKWEMKPTFLRRESLQLLQETWTQPLTCENLAWREFADLRYFVRICDNAGLEVPIDSLKVREVLFSDMNFRNHNDFPSTWPPDELLEIMAFGRLHGLATRLLDWSTNPYIAAYFAASEALLSQDNWVPDQRIAIFELDCGPADETYLGEVRLLEIRGSISPNVVAQQGVFTVHPSVGNKGEMAIVKSLENYLPHTLASPIKVFTIPVRQAPELYRLCDMISYNAARLYPGPEGAVRNLREVQMYALAQKSGQG